ncbi:MAG: SAM-dependent methyltransferase [Candidatus Enteromonas sp.]|nr:SAM-dependent methyltransferase [Candidatus Enteromonas sp.]
MDFEVSLRPYLSEGEIALLLHALEGTPSHCLVLQTKKMSDETLLSLYPRLSPHPFVPHAYYYKKEEYDFGKSLLYDAGVISIQDASSMMVPFLLDPKPGERILDLCAAPGGKSILASLLMNDEGVILANDISFPRAKAMSSNVERMGRGNIIVNSSDFSFSATEYAGYFDKIILDAPCSGSAMFRKNPQAKEEWSPSKLRRCVKAQRELLEIASTMLAPGGVLAYSTCSFSYEENEENILWFLERHPEFSMKLAPIDSPLFFHSKTLKETIHFFPHRFDGEGQFLALLQKDGILFHQPERKSPCPLEGKFSGFLKEYGLENRHNFALRDKFYSLTEPFRFSHLNTLRAGVKLFELRDIFLPDHALARYLTSEYSLPLSSDQARQYLRGETFPLEKNDGFYIVSYCDLNLGWIKVTKGVAKNHYPKGLRRDYPLRNSSL